MEDQKPSLRDHLENAVEQVEAGIEPSEIQALDVAPQDDIQEEVARDESGRFASKEADSEPTYEDQAQIEEVMADPEIKRPTTWKKEYLSLWDKAYEGQPMSKEEGRKLTAYLDQRESEYKKGVSTYKEEARRAKAYEDAVQPYIGDLERRNIPPAKYLETLAKFDQMLTYANPEQKTQLFQQLATNYGIQLNQGGQVQNIDPYAQQLTQLLQQNQQEVQLIKGRLEQEETNKLLAEVNQFASNTKDYPHFEELRDRMAQLLAADQAQNLQEAYELAKWQVPEIRELEIKHMIERKTTSATKQAQVQKAKAAAVSVRSTTPSGAVSDGVDKKDRRAVLAAQMAESFDRL
jgi:hypothetical protein